jgi:hypothetical protein
MNEFIRMCNLASSYDESAKVFGEKLLDLDRDERLLFGDFKELDQHIIKDKFFLTYLVKKILRYKRKYACIDIQISKYIEFKRNLYRSEEFCYLDNAREQQDVIYK